LLSIRLGPIVKLLGKSKIYNLAMNSIGGRRSRQFIAQVIDASPGHRILDIGCGTAEILDYLPPVQYLGVDSSPEYISQACNKFGERGTFQCTSVDQLPLESADRFDRILLLGVLHHLPDEQIQLLMTKVNDLLSENGKLITHDPVFVKGQSVIVRFFLNSDRGAFVRYRDQYLSLISKDLLLAEHQIKTDLLRIPYSILFTTSVRSLR
jgi:SAM-dependent methyltransferase